MSPRPIFRKLIRSILPNRMNNPRRATRTDDRGSAVAKHSCPACSKPTEERQLALNLFVCTHCEYHYRISAVERIKTLLDGGELGEFSADIQPTNPIDFPDYTQKVREAQDKTGLDEAVTTGVGRIEGRQAAFAFMSFKFMGGSMGSVVGERIARTIMYAADRRMPCIIFTASGGARMQEGIFSLMQMAKTSHAAAMLAEVRCPLFVVLTDPTTGGVTASFSMLGDVTLAEPGALIGFAGPRVIEGTIRQKLPPGFQRAEFQKDKGFVDLVVPRSELRSTLVYLIDTHAGGSTA